MQLVGKWEEVLVSIEDEFFISPKPLRSRVFDRHVGAMRIVLWKLREQNTSFSEAAETYRLVLRRMKDAARTNDRATCVRCARYLRHYWLNNLQRLSK